MLTSDPSVLGVYYSGRLHQEQLNSKIPLLPPTMSQPQPQQHSSTQAPSKPVSKPRAPLDIDNYLNPFIPRNPLRFLPASISYWFGYRCPKKTIHPHPILRHVFHTTAIPWPQWYYTYHIHTLTLYLSILIGAFCGVAIIENVFLALPQLSGHTVPIVIASFGAAAILEYNTIESPLAQPRNLVLGHFFSAVVGVGITKLFLLLPPDQFEDLRWLAGALAVGVASVLMSMTKTVHPPAGATALLAATNAEIQVLGWWLLPLVLLAASLMLASALVVNNGFGRRFPVYWWTPIDLKALREARKLEKQARKTKEQGDVEKGQGEDDLSQAETESGDGADAGVNLRKEDNQQGQLSRAVTFSSVDRVPRLVSSTTRSTHATTASPAEEETEKRAQRIGEDVLDGKSILVTSSRLVVPEWLELSDWEDKVLRILMVRIREREQQAEAAREDA